MLATLLGLGIQVIFGSFFLALLTSPDAVSSRPRRLVRRGARDVGEASSTMALPFDLATFDVVLLLSWAMTNPPFASPDEPAHYLRAIAVGGGSVAGAVTVDVPAGLGASTDAACNAFLTNASAACLDDVRATDRATRQETAAGPNPPLAYLLPGVVARQASDLRRRTASRGSPCRDLGGAPRECGAPPLAARRRRGVIARHDGRNDADGHLRRARSRATARSRPPPESRSAPPCCD